MVQRQNINPHKSEKRVETSLFNIKQIEWPGINNDAEDHFQIIWITEGCGDFGIDLQRHRFESNQLFFVKPGNEFSVQAMDEISGYVISFSESFLGTTDKEFDPTWPANLFQLFVDTNRLHINELLSAELKDLAGWMIREQKSDRMFRDEVLRRYLKIFFIQLSRQLDFSFQATKRTRNMDLVQKFISLLDDHYKTEKTVAGYAGMLGVTPNYLNEIIKKITDHSAGYHIRQRVVLEAKRRATYSDCCMKQIGYFLGFNDMAHFSKFFKTATGVNFTDFKKERLVIATKLPGYHQKLNF